MAYVLVTQQYKRYTLDLAPLFEYFCLTGCTNIAIKQLLDIRLSLHLDIDSYFDIVEMCYIKLEEEILAIL
jgi:hypothetical protein